MLMNAIEDIRRVARDPIEYARRYTNETGVRALGYFCSYTPEEIIHAAGILPVRLFGFGKKIVRADAHLQSYSCSLVRSALELGLSGELDFLGGMVFPHTCDSIQRLSDIYRMNIPFGFFEDIVLPVKLNSESAREYIVNLLAAFTASIERGFSVTVSDEALRRSLVLYNEIRDHLGALYRLRSRHPRLCSGADLHDVVSASMVMDRTGLAALLADLVGELSARAEGLGDDDTRKRIILSGGICSHPDVYGIIEDAGGAVVWDDLCTGTRYFEGALDTTRPPLEAIAHRYVDTRVTCPAKHRSLTDRADSLAAMATEHRADGVVFLLLKFCDPHAFDYPHLKERLDREGVPSMLVEIEDTLPPAGQLMTRFEAFVESLG